MILLEADSLVVLLAAALETLRHEVRFERIRALNVALRISYPFPCHARKSVFLPFLFILLFLVVPIAFLLGLVLLLLLLTFWL